MNTEEKANELYPNNKTFCGGVAQIARDAFAKGARMQKEVDDKELSEKVSAAYQLGLADKEKLNQDYGKLVAELKERIGAAESGKDLNKLMKAFDNPEMKLNNREWEMLRAQFCFMRDYLQALTDRCVYYGLIDAGDLGIHY